MQVRKIVKIFKKQKYYESYLMKEKTLFFMEQI